MKRGPDATALLLRALAADAAARGLAVDLDPRRATPWASVTFTGMQHEVSAKAAAGARFTAWLDALPSADLELRGHTADVAIDEIVVSGGDAAATLTVLTIEA